MGYVLVVGSCNIDMNIYSERLPTPGETVTGGTFKQCFGGKGANQAVAAARAGVKTVFMGSLGTDLYGEQMIEQLNREGIDLCCVARDPSEASGVAFIFIDKNGENMISVAPGANARLSSQHILDNAEIIRNASVVIAQMEIPIETLEMLFKIAKQGNTIRILNPAPLRNTSRELLKHVDVIVPNEGELFRLNSLLSFNSLEFQNIRQIVQASFNISSLGVNHVITTLGGKGCVVYSQGTEGAKRLLPLNVEAIDTVGAGDCFNGVMASKLCEGKDLLTAVRYATVAASIAVTRKGAQDSMPYKDEIDEKFKEIKDSFVEIPLITNERT
ncbi:MAG: ribokinase [Promethearchaeota archaeon]